MIEKSEEVLWLEGVLERPLHPLLSGSVLDVENRKSYTVDDKAEVWKHSRYTPGR